MLDQTFTIDNFRKIFDYENRKGVYLENLFFSNVENITRELKEISAQFKQLKKEKTTLSLNDYEKRKDGLNRKKDSLKNKKEELLVKELKKISVKINKSDYRINLKEVSTINGKSIYTINDNPCAYFAVKQTQYNLKKLYKVKQSNRHNIICQLRSILNDAYPKFIFRTDIKDFYENIPRTKLIKSINDNHLLSLFSQKIINLILNEYTKITGNEMGIPRGISISAYLSEIYMRDIDAAIKSIPDVIFYARYVDDIIVVFTLKPNLNCSMIENTIDKYITKSGLKLNKDKTKCINSTEEINKVSLEYLGYKFSFNGKGVGLGLSSKKISDYKQRIDLSFEKYVAKAKHNEKIARKILIKRIRFLTGNTRLLNNKKNAVVGIFFSNSLITNTACLNALDRHLLCEINKLNNSNLEKRLFDMKFTDGFTQRRFSKFSASDLSEIVKVWKHVS